VVAGPGHFRREIHSGGGQGHDDAAATDEPNPDVARQPLRGGAPPHGAHRRWLARQPGDTGASWRSGQAAASGSAGAQLHDLSALTLDGKDVGMLRERVSAYEAAGVQHVMVHPQDREVDDWDTVIEGVGRVAAG